MNFFWFRRDLRLGDNAGLYHALRSGKEVQCVFIFDTEILDKLEDKNDLRVVFIHRQITKLNEELIALGSSLLVRHGKPEDVWNALAKEFKIESVFTNHDYEPYAKVRDEEIKSLLQKKSIQFNTFKDQVIFEKSEVTKDDGLPYTVFTPYMKKWRTIVKPFHLKSYPTEKYFDAFTKVKPGTVPSLKEIGFNDSEVEFPKPKVSKDILENYIEQRDIPSVKGTSRLSIHLRFGTISIRKLVRQAWPYEKWLNELIWREFYMMILWHFPHVVNHAFKSQYDRLPWHHNESDFNKWCEGKTGYPIVDAGMRELNATGFMHNRVRMVVSMFLTKYLLIDWRWGEAYFAQKLLDYELSSNNGGWQWSSGTGVDAAPYFRLFSMSEQTKRFDPELKYIRKWVPEFEDFSYPQPMIDYAFARKRCLEFFKKHLQEKN